MYHRHFGFKERPFRLVPDPAYLFMGRSHQEAMALLTYAIDAGDGFAAVIGEVGTGKTTLCRAFLEALDAHVTSAYIFNPASDPVDLIRAINRDLGLEAGTDDLQDLIQALNGFLIEEKGNGRTVILVIDEAQNLSRPVLEQIRLLSNLETSRSKLLQIILVGQPELQHTLAAVELRQLRQRISLSCRLRPLSLAETGAYIRHRLAVAAQGAPVDFSPAAVRAVFRFSGGIPRLINTACDRALLTAYGQGGREITGSVARKAIAELQSSGAGQKPPKQSRRLLATGLVLAVAISAIAFGLNHQGVNMPAPAPILPPEPIQRYTVAPKAAPEPEPPPRESPQPATVAAPESAQEDQTGQWAMNRVRALEILASRWGISTGNLPAAINDDSTFFQASAKALGMELYLVSHQLGMVAHLDLPALLTISGTDPVKPDYAVVVGIKEGQFLLADAAFPRTGHMVSMDELARSWTGTAYILWKDFYQMAGEIPRKASGDTVVTLKMLLREIGYQQVGLSAVFDETSRKAVMDLQARHNLPVDGVVGSLTKIVLYNTRPGLGVPKLRNPVSGQDGEMP